MALPQHLAIIMDGNGRWAHERNHGRFFGHVRGAMAAKSIIEACAERGIKYLTLFTFSTENWRRPPAEVNFLMKLLTRQLRRETANLMENNIRFSCIGDLNRLPDPVRLRVEQTITATAGNTGLNLVFALSYGGQQEIAAAVRSIAAEVKAGLLRAEDITEETISQRLSSRHLPSPDMIIRTSGEQRISNFFLWQAAYSELYFTNKYWPDFAVDDLDKALVDFSLRQRRFGRTPDQMSNKTDKKRPQPVAVSLDTIT